MKFIKAKNQENEPVFVNMANCEHVKIVDGALMAFIGAEYYELYEFTVDEFKGQFRTGK